MNLSFNLTHSINHIFTLPYRNHFSSSLLSPHLLGYVRTRYEDDGFKTHYYGSEVSCDKGIVCSVRGFIAFKNGQYRFDNYYFPAVVAESPLFADLHPLAQERIVSETITNFQLLNFNSLILCADYHVKSNLLEALARHLTLTPSTYRSVGIYLDQPLESIWSSLRKSYKPLINKSKAEDLLMIYDSNNISKDVILECMKLHEIQSGRITRSLESWLDQFSAIQDDTAFISCIIQGGVITAFGYFTLYDNHSYYFSSASRLHHSDRVVNTHSLIWEAICYARKRGVRFIQLGIEDVAEQVLDPKQQSIARFKSGFARDSYTYQHWKR